MPPKTLLLVPTCVPPSAREVAETETDPRRHGIRRVVPPPTRAPD